MPDDKEARDDQADREEQRQRERMAEEARTRADEEEPVRKNPGGRLGELDVALEQHDYPTTTTELVAAFGEYPIQTQGGEQPIEEILAGTENQTFESADDVRRRIQGLIVR